MSVILVAAVDAAFEQRVRDLQPRPFTDTVQRWEGSLADAEELKAVADRSPTVVILGPDLSEDDAFERAHRFDRFYPAICVLVVADPGPNTWRRALAAGVRGVIAPGCTDDELRTHLEGALEIARQRAAAGVIAAEASRPRVITVVSPKGGSGKTILSSNLAVGLAMRASGQAVLIDLDLQFGDAAYALMLTPQHTMADAVSALTDLDATTLKVFLTRHQSGLYVLCAPDEPAEGESISVAATAAIIRMLAAEFRYVVIDTAAGLGEHTLAALEQSTDLVLVSDMDVPSVRNLRKALDALDLLGMMTPTRHFVLNRSDSRVGLDKGEVAAAAGMAIEMEIPSSRHVPISLNQGMPLILGEPKSLVARRITQLVERLDHSPAARFTESHGGRP
jgi:pilus assembly protein CpaE